jgi:hypothetical protein
MANGAGLLPRRFFFTEHLVEYRNIFYNRGINQVTVVLNYERNTQWPFQHGVYLHYDRHLDGQRCNAHD